MATKAVKPNDGLCITYILTVLLSPANNTYGMGNRPCRAHPGM